MTLSRASEFDASGALGGDRRRRGAHSSNSSPRLCASASGVRIIRALKLTVIGVFGRDGCVSDSDSDNMNTAPRDCHWPEQNNPPGFGYGRSVNILLPIQNPYPSRTPRRCRLAWRPVGMRPSIKVRHGLLRASLA